MKTIKIITLLVASLLMTSIARSQSAGPDQTVCQHLYADLTPTGAGSWTVGPAPTGQTSSILQNRVYHFSAPGVYYYVWNFTGGTDTVAVTVLQNDAGPDVMLCDNDTAASTAAVGSGTWSIIPGNPDASQFFLTNLAVTHIEYPGSVAGYYNYLWTNTNGCYDTMSVVKSPCTPGFAGPDQTLSCIPTPGGSVTMAATAPGQWSYLPTNPGYPVITDSWSANTTITDFPTGGAYGFLYTSGAASDTVWVTVTARPATPILSQTGFCLGHDSLIAHPTVSNGQIFWLMNGGAFFTTSTADSILVPTQTGLYLFVTISSDGCQSLVSDTLSMSVCVADSVWPGDVNNDRAVSNVDLLPIGMGYGNTGPVRVVQGNVWQADSADTWGSDFIIYGNGADFKHADCNGDGTINMDDTLAIVQNYGLIHAKTSSPAPWRSGIPALSIQFSRDTVLAGDTLVADIILGDAALQVNNIYGLAFTYNFDPIITDSTSVQFGFAPSWLGGSANSISIHKDFPSAGMVQAAITGINHLNRSGYGVIAHVRTIITTDNINGKDLSYYVNHTFISDVVAINEQGDSVSLNDGVDSNRVGYLSTGIIDQSAVSMIKVYPNPSAGRIELQASDDIMEISASDMIGQQVYQQSGMHGRHQSIDLSGLGTGVYILRITTGDTIQTIRLTIAKQ
ncbi:MAG: T9SS type A sorting domain-containing protein [Bacteroidetes bacterium]|nr:T9SS type A sorting domain-containing protein [Bacteroidota bacterium]